MGLTRYVLKRPVTTILALLCILVFGISSVFSATLEQMPDTDQPMLIIRASYQGATPEDMDELVTKPIEDQVSRLEGVKSMSSISNEGNAMIMLEYDYDADMDDAYNELTRSLNSMRGLPDDCTTSVMEMNMNGGNDIMLSISHDTQEDLYDYVDQNITPVFEQLSTVFGSGGIHGRFLRVREGGARSGKDEAVQGDGEPDHECHGGSGPLLPVR